MKFALFFGNRGFMPAELIKGAREDMKKAVTDAGYEYLIMDEDATRYGAVETREEGAVYAKWLKSHEGEYDGVILCMPIFIDENGAIAALRDAGVPILMQAYPDEIGKMDFQHRRDAFCGKFSVTDVFEQYQVPYTVMTPHVVHPLSKEFSQNLRDFAGVCRVVGGMKRFNIGCIGARTTAFKTVRFDEVTMQRHGINVESFDLSELFEFVRAKADDDEKVLAKKAVLENYADFSKVPEDKKIMLSKISVVIDEYIENYNLDAVALRCWNEMETYLRVCPCVLVSELNDRGIVCSCEIDMCSAITMRALSLATEGPAACLDWNNNYGEDPDKVILFHCGSTAQKLMKARGEVTSHKMFDKGDPGSGWGTNEGRIDSFPMTYSLPTDVQFYDCGYSVVPYLDGKFACYALSYTGGATLKWFRDNFFESESEKALREGKNVYALLDSSVKTEPSEILVLPHFAGACTPYMDMESKAAFVGITLETTKFDIYKALMEGTSYEMRLNFELLEKASGKIHEIRATGGGATSDVWLQIKADVSGISLTALGCKEIGAAGTAALAGCAIGIYDNLESTVGKMANVRKVYEPNADRHEIYNKLYKSYCGLYDAVKGLR